MKKIILLTTLFILSFSYGARAMDFSVAAVINGEAISNFALFDRINLIINSSGIENTQENRNKFASQSLSALVNETLQKQVAKEIGVEATDEDLSRAILEIEGKNNLEAGGFEDFMESQNIAKPALMEQLKAQILWKKIVRRKIYHKIVVSDFEIKDTVDWLSSKNSIKEVYLSDIFISNRGKESETETLRVMTDLVNELRSGKSFSSIAKQFSESKNAANGGVIGWVPIEKLSAEIQIAIEGKANEITDPIKIDDGYRIIKVGNIRDKQPEADEKRVTELLKMQKLELESRKFMKNLRASAFIEIRL